MKRFLLFFISGILFVLGIGIFAYKYFVLDFPIQADRKSAYWDLEVHLSFEALNKPVKTSLFLPSETGNFVIYSEQFLSGKLGLVTERKKINRRAVWSGRKIKGRQHLYYRVLVQKAGGFLPAQSKPGPIRMPELSDLKMAAVKYLWNEVYSVSADLDTIMTNLFKQLSKAGAEENMALLAGSNNPSESRQIETAALLLQYAGIPARMVSGFDIREDSLQVKAVKWLEVYYQKKWHSYTPRNFGSSPPDSYLAWWRGSDPFYTVRGVEKISIQVTAQKNETRAIDASIIQSRITSPLFIKFSLLSLPIQNQVVYRITLLIPIGAFLVVLLRNIIGMKTFGIFMPVLIALSFRETQLFWGVCLFSIVMGLGLGVRFYLEQLKLLVVPRLSAILITVIIIIAGLNVLTASMGISLGLSISLFPVVILSMAIERISILWDERGPVEALSQGAGTLLASILIYFLIQNETVEHIMFYFPEVLLILLSMTLLLGRYSGLRLIELYRFRDLVKRGQ